MVDLKHLNTLKRPMELDLNSAQHRQEKAAMIVLIGRCQQCIVDGCDSLKIRDSP